MKIIKFSNKNFSTKKYICPVCGHTLQFGQYSKRKIFKDCHFQIGNYIYHCDNCLDKVFYGENPLKF